MTSRKTSNHHKITFCIWKNALTFRMASMRLGPHSHTSMSESQSKAFVEKFDPYLHLKSDTALPKICMLSRMRALCVCNHNDITYALYGKGLTILGMANWKETQWQNLSDTRICKYHVNVNGYFIFYLNNKISKVARVWETRPCTIPALLHFITQCTRIWVKKSKLSSSTQRGDNLSIGYYEQRV